MGRLFRFECKRTWASLSPTRDAEIRHCDDCGRTVHLAHGLDPALELAAGGRSVALMHDEPSRSTKTVGTLNLFSEGFPSTSWLVGVEGPRMHETVRLTAELDIDGAQFTESRAGWTATLADGSRLELVDGDQLTIGGTHYVFKSVS